MRLGKARKSRKYLNYYRAAHGFRQPFTVLVDGTALQTALNLGVSLKDELPKLLGGRAEVVVTRPIVAELRALGKEFAAASAAAQKLRYVASDGSGTALESVLALVRGGNPQRLCVLSEDPQLLRRVGAIVGVPLLRFARDRLVLEAPCRVEGAAMPEAPEPSLPPARQQGGGGAGAGAGAGGSKRSAGGSGSGDDGDGTGHASEGAAPVGGPAAAQQQQQHMRKKRMAPNPLSCRKKVRKAPPHQQAAGKDDDESSAKRRRKRQRVGKGSVDVGGD